MKWFYILIVFSAFALSGLPVLPGLSAQQQSNQWAQWRGPLGTGASETANPPSQWSDDSDGQPAENIRWKTELPGLGHSTPIVWNDSIFVTSAIAVGEKFDPIPDTAPGSHDNLDVDSRYKFVVICVGRTTGKIRWQTEVHQAIPHEGGHYTASLASASPSTDGKHVYAFFGTYGLYCLDFEGNVVWEKSFGKMNTKHGHGEGASPYLYGDSLVVNWDHEGNSFLVALDKTNGETRWKRDRDEVTSWSSPIVYQHENIAHVIVAGTGAVRSYDLRNGELIWQCRGLSANVVATPIAHDGMVYVGSSYDTRAMFAIDLAGRGDITGTEHVVWHRVERTPYVPSPLLYRGSLYFLRHYQGILSVVDAKTGDESVGPFRINGLRNIYASPVAADGKIFITDRDGMTIVISEPDLPKMISANRLNDRFSASMAMKDNDLLIRGEKFLYCISRK